MSKYIPRLTEPEKNNEYYTGSINPFARCGHSMFGKDGNCTTYAWARWAELLDKAHNLSIHQAEVWYEKNDGYARGQEPKLGAVICWSKGDPSNYRDGAGHVAIVEEIKEDGTIICSNSGEYGSVFSTLELKPPYNYHDGFKLQGFIYIPLEFEEEKKEEPVNDTKKLYLSKDEDSWRVYPLNKRPVVGNECGFLRPYRFGGLTYDILGYTYPDVAIIQTQDFGKVQIYVAKSTGAIIK